MLMEMIVLTIGAFFVGLNSTTKAKELHPFKVGGMSLFFVISYFPIARYFGEFYNEFSQDSANNGLIPIVDYFWPLFAMMVSIGISYGVDIAQLRKADRADRFTKDLFRLCIQFFLVGFVSFVLLLFFIEGNDGVLPDKWVPITILLVLRTLLEISNVRRRKKEQVV